MYIWKVVLVTCMSLLAVAAGADSTMIVNLKQQIVQQTNELKGLRADTENRSNDIMRRMQELEHQMMNATSEYEKKTIRRQYWQARTEMIETHAKLVAEGSRIVNTLQDKVARLNHELQRSRDFGGIDMDNAQDRDVLEHAVDGFHNQIRLLSEFSYEDTKSNGQLIMLRNTFNTMNVSLRKFYQSNGTQSLTSMEQHLQDTAVFLAALKNFLRAQANNAELCVIGEVRKGVITAISSHLDIGGGLIQTYDQLEAWDRSMVSEEPEYHFREVKSSSESPSAWIRNWKK